MVQMIPNLKTSRTELVDISKAWLALSFAFALVYSGIFLVGGKPFTLIFTYPFLQTLLIAFGTAGIGFLLHELAHKFVAQHYGCVAEFRAFPLMLYLAVGLALLIGFIFAAPGAVMISGMITRKENGIISMAGPGTNFVLSLIFLGLSILFPPWRYIFATGFSINAWLGLFNMIPFGNFDGVKIFYWNKTIWGIMVVLGIVLTFILPSSIA